MLELQSIPGVIGGHDILLPSCFHASNKPRFTVDVPTSPPPDGRARILLVESDTVACTSLTEALTPHYQVKTVGDGFTAWQSARNDPPDLVLAGLYVAGIDKLALTRSLRADACTATLPIVLLTASANRELLLRCLSAGASNFLLMPFSVTELLGCLHLELQLRRKKSSTA